jgi:hypothetical protein
MLCVDDDVDAMEVVVVLRRHGIGIELRGIMILVGSLLTTRSSVGQASFGGERSGANRLCLLSDDAGTWWGDKDSLCRISKSHRDERRRGPYQHTSENERRSA